MRKSTVMVMAILMTCFGTMLVAASVLSKPMRQDAMLAKELTRLLLYQQVIEKGTEVVLVRRPASKGQTLAEEGRGVVVKVTPSKTISTKRGGIRTLFYRITSQLQEGYEGMRLDWLEFQLKVPEAPPEDKPFRTLMVRSASGFSAPDPGIEKFEAQLGAIERPRTRVRKAAGPANKAAVNAGAQTAAPGGAGTGAGIEDPASGIR